MTTTDLTSERIGELLATRWCGRSLEVHDSTSSTNDDARARSLAGAAHGHVVIADTQAHGRGSRGRAWLSPPGTDLYLSLIAAIPLPPADFAPLTLAVGVAVAEAVSSLLGTSAGVQVKWPNDVWVNEQKIAGILVESASLGDVLLPAVIGIGLNVNRTTFPPDLDTPATSLALAAGRSFDRAQVLAALLAALERWIDTFVDIGVAPVVNALMPLLALRGLRARCDDVVGTVLGVSERGALLLDTGDGVRGMVAGTLRRAP